MDKRILELARRFQQEQLRKLAVRSFAELSAFPEHQNIAPPSELAGESFAIRRRANEDGGIEISIYHRFSGVYSAPEWIKKLSGVEIRVLERGTNQSFDIYPDETIVWPSFEHNPSD